MDGPKQSTNHVRIMGASAVAGLFAPVVFVVVLVLRKVTRRTKFYARGWNKRLQHEITRWT